MNIPGAPEQYFPIDRQPNAYQWMLPDPNNEGELKPAGHVLFCRAGQTPADLFDETANHADQEDPSPILIPYGEFRLRWEPAELEALFEAKKTDWRVEDYVTLASAQGHVNLTGETAAAAKALFIHLAILSQERADEIFAAG